MKILYVGFEAADRPEYAEQVSLDERLSVALYEPVRTAGDVKTAMLLSRGLVVGQDTFESLQRRSEELAKTDASQAKRPYQLYGLDEAEEQAIQRGLNGGEASAPRSLKASDLEAGQTLSRGVYEVSTTLVYVNGDYLVTSSHLKKLATLRSGSAFVWYAPNIFLERDDAIIVTLLDNLNVVLEELERERRREEQAQRRARRRPTKEWVRMAPNEPPLRHLAEAAERVYTTEERGELTALTQEAVRKVDEHLGSVWKAGVDRVKAAMVREQRRMVEDTMDRVLEYWDLMAELLNDTPDTHPLSAHANKTSSLSMQVATAMELSKSDIVDIGVAALLQDVGMGGMSGILEKTTPLTPSELVEIQKHPGTGADILERSEGIADRVPGLVRQAHERQDGSGYPEGRKGAEIHELARILCVANAYVGMISGRPYRPAAIPYDAVYNIIMSASHGMLDKDVVRALLKVLSICPIGITVRLDTGEIAQVRAANLDDCTQPVVAVLYDAAGIEVGEPEIRDLAATEGKIAEIVFSDEMPVAEVGSYD